MAAVVVEPEGIAVVEPAAAVVAAGTAAAVVVACNQHAEVLP